MLAGQAMLEMRLANADAVEAGVGNAVIGEVFATFSAEDFVNLQLEGTELAPGSHDIATRASAGFAARGVTGEAAVKGARAVVLRLIAARLLAEFGVELGVNDGH